MGRAAILLALLGFLGLRHITYLPTGGWWPQEMGRD
jgi:hypothetical protein